VLITGFEPFGGGTTNPSQDVVEHLQTITPENWLFKVLPVSFEKAKAGIQQLMSAEQPDIVLMLGLAGDASKYRLETQAVNLATARIPDNDGNQPIDVPVIVADEMNQVLMGTWPTDKLFEQLAASGHDVSISDNAGRYVCNATYYAALQQAVAIDNGAGEYRPRVGFLHIPPDRSLAETSDLVTEIVEHLAAEISEK